MGARHVDKLEKYVLCFEIRSRDWRVDCFAVEVGARGYCSESLRLCFRALDFKNKIIKSALTSLRQIAIKSSFVIWLSRDSKTWDKDFIGEDPLGKMPRNHHTCKKPPRPAASYPVVKETQLISNKACGLVNKGITCYVNSIVQSLRTLKKFGPFFYL